MKAVFSIEMPDDLLQEFLQVVRDFDTKHDPSHEDKVVVTMLSQSGHDVEELKSVFKAITPRIGNMRIYKDDL